MTNRRNPFNLRVADGQTMTEYAFILALIFAVVIVTVPMLGSAISAFFTTLTGAF
jgi:Flp pilus assembly pilin Flp